MTDPSPNYCDGKTALLLIDLQNDYFEGGKWPLQGIDQAAGKAAELLTAFRAQSLPVIFVRHEFEQPEAPFFAPGSEGAAFHDSLQPRPGESQVLKHKANSFQDTELKPLLDGAGIERLVICGAMSHMCIDAATRTAADMGYDCVLAEDACATRDLEFNGVQVSAARVHAAFMAALAFAYAEVTSTDRILPRLSGQ